MFHLGPTAAHSPPKVRASGYAAERQADQLLQTSMVTALNVPQFARAKQKGGGWDAWAFNDIYIYIHMMYDICIYIYLKNTFKQNVNG